MTVQEAITQCDELRPNQFGNEMKITWLNTIDGLVKNEIIDTHEGGEDIPFTKYTSSNMSSQLLITEPYSEVYVQYLMSQIDLSNAEMSKSNISVSMFNTSYNNFAKYYNRTVKPKSVKFNFKSKDILSNI